MTGINHIVTGAVIAGAVRQPALVVPLAFASHFALDSMPHFGFTDWDKARINQRNLIHGVITLDVILVIVLIGLFVTQGAPALFYIAGLAAFSPDLAWVYQFAVYHRMEPSKTDPRNRFSQFHERIQSRERPSGIYIEIAYLVIMTLLLIRLWP